MSPNPCIFLNWYIFRTGDIPKAPSVLESKKQHREEQAEEIASLYPRGLANLGNTCYFNSCVQVFKEINELVLKPAEEMKIREQNDRLCHNISQLLNNLRDKDDALRTKGDAIKPFASVLVSKFGQKRVQLLIFQESLRVVPTV